VLNHALSGLPADRIRYHTCYSIINRLAETGAFGDLPRAN